MRIPFASGNSKIAFTDNGVVVRDADGDPAVGHWTADSKTNALNFDVSGTPGTVACRYSFNESNQLEVQLRNQDGTLTDEVTVPGVIHVLDTTDVIYTPIDDTGHVTSQQFHLAGNLAFDDDNHLLVDFGGGSAPASITGNADAPIQALRNTSSATAKDQLRFVAVTTNSTGDGGTLTLPASIDIPGSWNVQDGTIVFNASGGTDPSNPLTIGFAGKFKGVSAGFVYTPGAGGGKAGFLIAGSHTWNSAAASWDVVLGFSSKTFQAQVSGQFASKDGLTIGGSLNIVKQGATQATFDLEMKVQKRFTQAGVLTFMADVSGAPGHPISYDLRLEGTFTFNGVALTFAAKVSNTGATVTLGIASRSNTFDLKFQLSMTLKGTNQPTVDLNFSFTLTMTFKNGKLVKGDPKPLTPGAHPGLAGH